MSKAHRTHLALPILLLLAGCLVVFAPVTASPLEREIDLGEGIGLPVSVYPTAQARGVLLWLPSERGVHSGMHLVAAEMAERTGYSLWIADPFAAWLLPASADSLKTMAPEPLARVIDQALAEFPVVYLLAHDRGSGLALRLALAWQLANPGATGASGIVLITPNLYRQTPVVGQPGVLEPVARATNLPVFAMQPALSPTALRFSEVVAALSAGGARVYRQLLPEVRDRFFFRPDATAAEQAMTERLPGLVAQALDLLEGESVPEQAAALPVVEPGDETPDARQRLTPYQGENADDPPALALEDLQGERRDLADLRGQVVLLNFWASWCPPCLHEMPSMQRIYDRYRDRGFTIAAVNLGESPERIRPFLEDLDIGFPIWLDPENRSARRWQVFAYPTSFLISRTGTIRYAIAGGIDWESPEAVSRIEQLLEEAGP